MEHKIRLIDVRLLLEVDGTPVLVEVAMPTDVPLEDVVERMNEILSRLGVKSEGGDAG